MHTPDTHSPYKSYSVFPAPKQATSAQWSPGQPQAGQWGDIEAPRWAQHHKYHLTQPQRDKNAGWPSCSHGNGTTGTISRGEPSFPPNLNSVSPISQPEPAPRNAWELIALQEPTCTLMDTDRWLTHFTTDQYSPSQCVWIGDSRWSSQSYHKAKQWNSFNAHTLGTHS